MRSAGFEEPDQALETDKSERKSLRTPGDDTIHATPVTPLESLGAEVLLADPPRETRRRQDLFPIDRRESRSWGDAAPGRNVFPDNPLKFVKENSIKEKTSGRDLIGNGNGNVLATKRPNVLGRCTTGLPYNAESGSQKTMIDSIFRDQEKSKDWANNEIVITAQERSY
ncbi:hypothetical protein WN55_09490 [Dufourea novaeangliae]|uniref:Uncharacterized protein n=1 Tax=Dufourea novaeangliae TaxID=178035 RepID=A0A154NYN1_DUFNO|nr:hypothetical protein WN55_09490 [Dufourea novaeangliae]